MEWNTPWTQFHSLLPREVRCCWLAAVQAGPDTGSRKGWRRGPPSGASWRTVREKNLQKEKDKEKLELTMSTTTQRSLGHYSVYASFLGKHFVHLGGGKTELEKELIHAATSTFNPLVIIRQLLRPHAAFNPDLQLHYTLSGPYLALIQLLTKCNHKHANTRRCARGYFVEQCSNLHTCKCALSNLAYSGRSFASLQLLEGAAPSRAMGINLPRHPLHSHTAAKMGTTWHHADFFYKRSGRLENV